MGGSIAHSGVRAFFKEAIENSTLLFILVVSVGKLRRGVELIRYRGDARQANQLERWLEVLLNEFRESILDINQDIDQLWTTSCTVSGKRVGQADCCNGTDLGFDCCDE